MAFASTLAALGIIAIKLMFTTVSGLFSGEWFDWDNNVVFLLISLISPGLLVFIAIWIISVWVWALPKKDEELLTKLKQSSDTSDYDG